MNDRINSLLDSLSEYLAQRKGLLPLIGAVLVLLNLIIQFFGSSGFLAGTDLFLHLGIIIAILGFMLAWAL
jgi:hypothetical protein